MTKNELKRLLRRETGSDEIAPGYNHAIFSIRVPRDMVSLVARRLRENKAEIEEAYRLAQADPDWKLLDHVCLVRPRSVVVAIPFETPLNVLSDILARVLDNTGAEIPNWS